MVWIIQSYPLSITRGDKMEYEKASLDCKSLCSMAKEKLVEENLISRGEKLLLTPCHNIILQGKMYTHYIITCLTSGKKFFLKISKGNDTASHCNDYLKGFRNDTGDYIYPIILVPEFEFNGIRFFILNFIEGQSLDTLQKSLSNPKWKNIAQKLQVRLDELSTIHANSYSEYNNFTTEDCATILIEKFSRRLKHPVFHNYSKMTLNQAYQRCIIILDDSHFSTPTLLHMDVKPANIIYDSKTGFVTLVDFEFARFGDYDYGWVQFLLSGINAFNEEYKKIVVPYVGKNRLSLREAINTPKFQCYIFYQTACNLIYYHDHNVACPKDMLQLFQKMLNELSKE